jgi:hypothetical protein
MREGKPRKQEAPAKFVMRDLTRQLVAGTRSRATRFAAAVINYLVQLRIESGNAVCLRPVKTLLRKICKGFPDTRFRNMIQ